ncbi:UDP-N-acetylmuramate dehydrogenase [Candidatus Magnetaquicoccus inordinatus]|uniref:UDP-N-acetylmuramate dehydrogenase n=1 Tax=Candidatus Magnetaquicoccus inordinatus TaxID=2496818 RepID=UPI00102CAB5A|nr:UDP-N-acetylmuramate dehydrogenase [Candidatus Magnetaquicoccus inordinatus]
MDRKVDLTRNNTWIASLKLPILEQVSLAGRTTWKIGGPARWLLQPRSITELQQLLAHWPDGLPRLILGGGSNLLVDDNGFTGVVLELRRYLNRLELLSGHPDDEIVQIRADAGVDTRSLAHFARQNGLSGAEFLGGIPGTVGGALRMNAGAYGSDIQALLSSCEVLDTQGQRHTLTVAEMGMGYRSCGIAQDWLFVSALFSLRRDDPQRIRERMRSLNRQRREAQPLRYPSAGSTFKNPPMGAKAWQWIERVGMRGAREGQAQVSEQHCNFLLNLGGAQASEMRRLIEHIRSRVWQSGSVELALEVKIVGSEGLLSD